MAASIIGSGVLVLGLSLATGLWLLLQSIFPGSMVGWAFAVPVSALTLFVGLLLLLGGKRLRQQGTSRRDAVQLEAVRALVAHRRGAIGAQEVAAKLQLPEAQADALLTQLAREEATAVTLDVDEGGHVVYDFTGGEARWRVLEESLDAEVQSTNDTTHNRASRK